MGTSAGRKQRRATDAAVKRGVKRKPSVELATKLELDNLVKKVNEALKLLSDNQEVLGRNVNQNLSVIQGAFHFVDAHQHVSRRILNDVALGRLQMLVDDTGVPQAIDYEWYHGEYHKMRGVVLFIGWIRKMVGLDQQQEGEAETPTTEPKQPPDDFTFGGDYASPNAPLG